MKAWAVQQAIHARLAAWAPLVALVGTRIYDDVSPEGHLPAGSINPATAFPYVTHGVASSVDWSTDDDATTGVEVVYMVHGWSRYAGAKEVKQIADAVYAALNRYALVVSGANVVLNDFDDAEYMRDPDGKTRHSVQRFRILVHVLGIVGLDFSLAGNSQYVPLI